jgi:hypothetical protein
VFLGVIQSCSCQHHSTLPLLCESLTADPRTTCVNMVSWHSRTNCLRHHLVHLSSFHCGRSERGTPLDSADNDSPANARAPPLPIYDIDPLSGHITLPSLLSLHVDLIIPCYSFSMLYLFRSLLGDEPTLLLLPPLQILDENQLNNLNPKRLEEPVDG